MVSVDVKHHVYLLYRAVCGLGTMQALEPTSQSLGPFTAAACVLNQESISADAQITLFVCFIPTKARWPDMTTTYV